MKRLFVFFAFLSAYQLVGSLYAQAGEEHLKTGFFEKDSVRDVFGTPLTQTEQKEVEYFVPQPPKLKEVPAAAMPPRPGQPLSGQIAKINAAPEDSKDPVASELLSKFGDPSKDAPIQGVENAPTPFKGLMAALEAKRDDLAFEYARQYIRHIRNLKNRSERVMGLTNLAMEQEGMMDPGTGPVDPSFRAEMARIVNSRNDLESGDIDDAARGIIEDAILERNSSFGPGSTDSAARIRGLGESTSGATPRENSETVSPALRSKLPVDPRGQVDVFLFLSFEDEQSMNMARQMQFVIQLLQGDSRTSISVLRIGKADPEAEKHFRMATGATFAVKDGSQIVRMLRISTLPSVAFVARTSGSVHIEAGLRGARYITQVIRFMEGANE